MWYQRFLWEVKNKNQKRFKRGVLFWEKRLILVGIIGGLVLSACGQGEENKKEKPKEVVRNFLKCYDKTNNTDVYI